MGLQQPPKPERKGRVFLKMVFLVVLVAVAGVAVWGVSIDSRIDLVEDLSVASLELDPNTFIEVGELEVHVVDLSTGELPVVLLHDIDVSGGVVFDQLTPLLEGRLRPVILDLPGFGLSERVPEIGDAHTVGAMAALVGEVIDARYGSPVVVAGVGLGGQVGAELAVTRPEVVQGLVMIDVDFWRVEGWRGRLQRLPFIGRAMTYTFETSGSRASAVWAPHCADGGWCPTQEQMAKRQVTATIADSTDSIHAFRMTPTASLVPSDLDRITVPTIYVWSTMGSVGEESVDRIAAEIPDVEVREAETWMAHVETPAVVAEAIEAVAG
jgi:pimeloyl-ACP methyl ester carboxylesterase